MPTAHEQFSEQFHDWELRGRGWKIYGEPVQPEPPFVPFQRRYLPETPVADDGRRPTILSSLVQKLARKIALPAEPAAVEPEEEPEPTPLIREPLIELQVALPADLDLAKDSFEQFFSNVSLCQEPIAFELLGVHKRVVTQFATSKEDAPALGTQLQAQFPAAQFRELEGSLEKAWDAIEGDYAFAVEFGLEKEFMLPLAAGKSDPFIGTIAALSKLQENELALFQVLWQPVQNPWAESILRSVTREDDKPFFIDSPELTEAAEKKIAMPLFAVVVRILARTDTERRLFEIARDLAASLRIFSNPNGNALIPLQFEDYALDDHAKDVLRRQTRRTGMLLNGDELAGFVHLPSSEVQSPVLLRDSGATKAAPDIVRKPPGIVIGDNEHLGEIVPVYLTTDQRVRHTHIVGTSGTGKSSLLFNMIQQDIENGEGVAVLDPHGDLVKQILGIIPDERIDDVVLVDTSDVEFPVSFNILQAQTNEEKNLLASDLVAVFHRLSSSWGEQMDTVLQNAILAVLKSGEGGTLLDLQRFLAEKPFRKEFLERVQDWGVVYFWQNVFPQLTGGKSIGSVLARLQDFFSRESIRNMVSQPQNKLDFADIMDSGKIFLARLPKGLGNENSSLLGTLLISKFQQIAMARQSQEMEARKDFWIYIDEFANFITPSMAEILSETRKYRVGLILAHHQLHQLQSSPDVASAVMAHPCTRVVFRVEDDDAKKLSDGFESFEVRHLKTLEKFHALVRVERNDFDFNLALRKPELPEQPEADNRRVEVIAASRAKYATPRAKVEAAWLANMGGNKPKPPPDTPSESPPPKPPTPPAPPAPTLVQPSEVGPEHSESPNVAELPKIAEVPKTAKPPPAVKLKSSVTTEIPEVTDSEKEKAVVDVADTVGTKLPGRGKARHQSIQKRIKEAALKLGFYAEREKQLAKDSMEAADVVIRRGHIDIAVEIAVAGGREHEFQNVKKCLAAGFSRIAVVATGRKFLEYIAADVQGALGSETAAKVGYYTPDEFIDELRKLAATSEQPPAPQPMAEKDKRHGFEIERVFPKQTPGEQKATQKAIHQVIQNVLKSPPPSK
ncbi:MAG TPA: type IV secretion system DNA-binding domain-containing protein [Pseudomonadales bacterium]|nr:type IV secretion system DNA-binding domain-containing protein [Pseudomonadales bacterium]